MTYEEAKKEMLKGKKVKLPDWKAHLFMKDEIIYAYLDAFDNYLQYSKCNTNHKERNSKRKDWEIYEERI